jgi:hypothetical protein
MLPAHASDLAYALAIELLKLAAGHLFRADFLEFLIFFDEPRNNLFYIFLTLLML